MRFLVSPVYMNIAQMNGSSTYGHTKNLIKALIDRGHFVYWHLPENYKYTPDPLENHQQVKVIKTEMYLDQYIEGSMMRGLDEMFSRLNGKYAAIDGIITSRTPIIPLLKAKVETPSVRMIKQPHRHSGKHFTGHSPTVPFFVMETFPKRMSKSVQINPLEYRLQAYGYLTVERVFFGGITDLQGVMSELRGMVSPASLKNLSERTFKVAPFGINIKKLQKAAEQQPPKINPMDQLRIISIGRIRTVNAAAAILERTDYLHRMGLRVDFKIPTSAARGSLPTTLKKDLKDVSNHVDILWSTPQDKFFEYLFAAHVAVVTSLGHNFPTAILEAIYAGVCVLVQPFAWIRYYLGKDYPFYYDGSHEQMLAMASYVRENWEEAQAKLKPYQEMMAEKFDIEECIGYIAKEIEDVAQWHYDVGTSSGGMREILSLIPDEIQSITFEEVMAAMKKYSSGGINIGVMNSTGFLRTRGMVDYCMRRNGWIDACDNEFPRYVRGGVFEEEVEIIEEEDEGEV